MIKYGLKIEAEKKKKKKSLNFYVCFSFHFTSF